jgi:hypothetical protein
MNERAEDLDQIGELLRGSTQQTINEVLRKADEDLKNQSDKLVAMMAAIGSELTQKIDRELSDKVRVDEV